MKKPPKKSGPKEPRKGPLSGDQWELFDFLCSIQCTQAEIAEAFDCSIDTLARRIKDKYKQDFAVIYEQKRGAGKISLRRAQWQKAVEGKDTTMLIWLGKQYLGQSDKGEDEDQRHWLVTREADGSATVKIMPPGERLKLIHMEAKRK